MNHFVRLGFTALLLVILFSSSSQAQSSQSYLNNLGSTPYGINIPVENGFINISNGNLHLEFPLSAPPQRGTLSVSERLTYDSRIWEFLPYGTNGSYHWWPYNVPGTSTSSGGWQLVQGNEVGSISSQYVSSSSSTCASPMQDYSLTTTTNAIIWTDPNGAAHLFNAYYVGTENDCGFPYNPQYSQTLTPGGAADGSGYSIRNDGNGNPLVIDNQGTQVYPQIIDRYGNTLSTDGNGNLKDSAGRVPVIKTQSGNITYYDVLAPNGPISNNGTRVRYTVTIASVPVATNFQQSDTYEWNPTTQYLTPVQSIQLPDGSQYSFAYDSYGELSQITLPTGGTVNYNYTNFLDSSHTENRWLTSRALGSNPAMTFTPSVVTTCANYSNGCIENVKMHMPSGDETLYALTLNNGAWNTSSTVYSGSVTSGQPLFQQTNDNTYANSCTSSSTCTATTYLSRSVSTQVLLDSPSHVQSKTESNFNPTTGKPSSFKEWDFVASNQSFPTNPARETDYAYTGNDLQQTTVLDGNNGNAQVSQTTYTYTASATPTTGIVQHGTANAGGPYLQKVSQSIGVSAGTLDTTFCFDDTGTLLSSTDPNGTTTYGHDAAKILVTSVTPPTPSSGVVLTNAATYDANSGVILTQTDPNGTKTIYSGYDPLSRPTEIDVQDSNSTLVAKTIYVYSSNQLGVHRYQNASVFADTETLYDAYGRLSRTAVNNGQSSNPWYQRDTCYDSSGRPSFQSTPYQGNGWSTAQVCSGNNGGATTVFDALGRPSSVTNADGATQYSYAGRAVQQTDVNGVKTITQADALGRTVAVCEISPNSYSGASPVSCGTDIAGTGYLTNYTYSLAGHLVTVSQGVQTRTFQTDSIGRTIQTVEPERGTTNYTYSYNGTGLQIVRSRPKANQTNSNTLTRTTTQYDTLGRMVGVSYDDNLTPLKGFFYDQAVNLNFNVVANNIKGRMFGAASGSGPTQTADVYSYDAVGNVTTMWQCAPSICGTSNQMSRPALQFGYDLAGNLTYEYDGASGGISYGRSPAGEITSVYNNTYQDSYNPSNLVSNVVNGPFGAKSYSLGNGLSVGMTYDILGRKVAATLCTGPAQTNCGSAVQGWATAYSGSRVVESCDSVVDAQYCYGHYYDEFNRLTASNTGHGTAYTYAYDRYGNRTQQVSAPSGPAPSYSFNTATNHNNSMTYDAAGNVLSDGFYSYTYDADGKVLTASGSSYVYNAFSQRVASSTGTANVGYGTAAEFLYDPFGHRTSTWITSINFGNAGRVYWDNQQIAYRAFNGQTFFEHQDWLGTERMRTNYQGQIASTDTSLGFGDGYSQNVWLTDGDQDNLHFTGLDHDFESNTDHAMFRQYSPTQGRWMSPDPYDGSYDWSNPQSLNRYSYVLNNPMAFTDPTGLTQAPTDDGGIPGFCPASYATCDPVGGYDPGWGGGDGGGGGVGTPSGNPTTVRRPSTTGNPWDEHGAYHPRPYSGPWDVVGDITGLGTQGCEFGVCGDSLRPGSGRHAKGCYFIFGNCNTAGTFWDSLIQAYISGIDSIPAWVPCLLGPQESLDTQDAINTVMGRKAQPAGPNTDAGSPGVPYLPNNNRSPKKGGLPKTGGQSPGWRNSGDAATNGGAMGVQYLVAGGQCAMGIR